MASSTKRLSFENILKVVGGASWYQFLVFVLISLAKFFPSMMATLPVFIAYKQKYLCRWSENATDLPEVPGNGTLVRDKCFVYRNDTPQLRVACKEWDFDTSMFETTIRSRYLLVCGWDFLAELSTTLFFMGFVAGSIFYGWLSDRHGRLVGIVASGTHLALTGIGAAFAPSYWLFATMRFLAGIGNGGLLATAFTMMAEVTDKKHRVVYCELVHNGFSYGSCLIALIGYLVRDCSQMQIIVACCIFLVWIFPLIIPESPRWLYTTGRLRRAEKAISFIARCNKRELSDTMRQRILGEESVELRQDNLAETSEETMEEEEEMDEERQTENKTSLLELLRERPLMRATIINWYSWFAVSVGFFATMYTLGDIGGNLFLNLFYSAIIEIPGRVVAIYIAKRWGRIPTISLTLLMGGIGCFINCILIGFPAASGGLQAVSIINKFWLAAAFDTIWTYSGELYPTVIRNIGLGAGSMWARLGGMLAPQVSLLFKIWPPLPLLIMGSLPFAAGLLVILLPETLNKDMLEDIKDMLRLVIQGGRVGRPGRSSRYMANMQTNKKEDNKAETKA